MGDVASLSSRCAACVLCVGSANEIPLQNSSTFNKFCCPYLVVSSSPRRRRVCWTLLGLLCLLCCMLCERADGFCGSGYLSELCDSCAVSNVARSRCSSFGRSVVHHQYESTALKVLFFAREPSVVAPHAWCRLPMEPAAS